MKDQEIRELVKDLESVGLSSNPWFLTVGEEGIIEIDRQIGIGSNSNIDELPIIKGMFIDFNRRKEILWFTVMGTVESRIYYSVKFKNDELAKAALIRITSLLNS